MAAPVDLAVAVEEEAVLDPVEEVVVVTVAVLDARVVVLEPVFVAAARAAD